MGKDWKFKLDKIKPDSRLDYLREDIAFEEIVGKVRVDMETRRQQIKYRPERAKGDVKGYRAEFRFSVTEKIFDVFFNGPHGYRAQYYKSPALGTEKNRLLLDQIKPILLEVSRSSEKRGMTPEEIEKSLNFPSAKVWIVQGSSTLRKDVPRQIEKNGKLVDPETILMLEIPRWNEAMERAYQAWKDDNSLSWSMERRALFGVQAPTGSSLLVKGSWVHEGKEYITEDKKDRAEHIHKYGFS